MVVIQKSNHSQMEREKTGGDTEKATGLQAK
jgi:hypothetical protein